MKGKVRSRFRVRVRVRVTVRVRVNVKERVNSPIRPLSRQFIRYSIWRAKSGLVNSQEQIYLCSFT